MVHVSGHLSSTKYKVATARDMKTEERWPIGNYKAKVASPIGSSKVSGKSRVYPVEYSGRAKSPYSADVGHGSGEGDRVYLARVRARNV